MSRVRFCGGHLVHRGYRCEGGNTCMLAREANAMRPSPDKHQEKPPEKPPEKPLENILEKPPAHPLAHLGKKFVDATRRQKLGNRRRIPRSKRP